MLFRSMTWYRLQNGQMGIEGSPNRPPAGELISLVGLPAGSTKVKNIAIFDLAMEEQAVKFPEDPAAFQSAQAGSPEGQVKTVRMVSDVREVQVKVLPRSGGLPTKERVQIEVTIKCVEPSQGNAERSRTITAEANVGAKAI